MHPNVRRRGARVGYGLGDLKSAAASEGKSVAKGYADDTFGKDNVDAGLKYGKAASDLYEAIRNTESAEHYSGAYWSGSSVLEGDASFQSLRKQLDAAASASKATRAERDNNFRKVGASAATIAAYFNPVVGMVVYAIAEGMIALGHWIDGDDPNSEEQRKRVVERVVVLWDAWHMVPPPYDSVVTWARTYADRIDSIIAAYDRTEATYYADAGVKWQGDWLGITSWAVENQDALPAVRDLITLGWFPFSFQRWTWSNGGLKTGDGSWVTSSPPTPSHVRAKGHDDDPWFEQCQTYDYKPGFLSAGSEIHEEVCTPSYDQMVEWSDPACFAIGVIVGQFYGVRVEPVVEAACLESRRVLKEIGPQPYLQVWRHKAVFIAAKAAAEKIRVDAAKQLTSVKKLIDPNARPGDVNARRSWLGGSGGGGVMKLIDPNARPGDVNARRSWLGGSGGGGGALLAAGGLAVAGALYFPPLLIAALFVAWASSGKSTAKLPSIKRTQIAERPAAVNSALRTVVLRK